MLSQFISRMKRYSTKISILVLVAVVVSKFDFLVISVKSENISIKIQGEARKKE